MQIEFIKSINCLIKDKLDSDMSILMEDPIKFSHLVDEFMQFDMQLKEILKSMGLDLKSFTYLASLNFLSQEKKLYLNWLQIERQLCIKKVDVMFSTISSNQSSKDLLFFCFQITKILIN